MGRILVIDDEPLVCDVLRRMLEKAGHQVDTAINGDEGIKMVQISPVDLVITDLLMPDKEGLETIMELRRKFPQIKIIAMSGGGTVGFHTHLQLAKKFGASHTFTKPLEYNDVISVVKNLLCEE